MLDIDEVDDNFDTGVMIHINSAFMDLNILGVGPSDGYNIESSVDKWGDFIGYSTKKLSGVKSFVYMKCKLIFDPPNNSFKVSAMEKQLDELGWKLSVQGGD